MGLRIKPVLGLLKIKMAKQDGDFAMITRRGLLAGGLAAFASAARAEAPLSSLVPVPRPLEFATETESLARLVAQSPYQGAVGAIVADARTGAILQDYNGRVAMPPASTMKALTTLYALEHLGAGYRFSTRILATGSLRNGRLDGDLWLVGSGDPHLDTTTLADLVSGLREIGLHEVRGQLYLVDGALPTIPWIDPSQADHAGYNPTISGLNLNFNRVYLAWAQGVNGLQVGFDARADDLRPAISGIGLELVDGAGPVLSYRPESATAREGWRVARAALTGEGGRWLPVRNPSAYMAEVFLSLARSSGIVIDRFSVTHSAPADAVVLSEVQSAPLDALLRSMLRYSTNLTAEVVGLRATQVAVSRNRLDLRGSADQMGGWLAGQFMAGKPDLHDHSGLLEASRITPAQMTEALVAAGPRSRLRSLLRPHRADEETATRLSGVDVVTKTGTLNFVSTLTGYIEGPNRPLAFAIFNADLARRAALGPDERDRPPGGRAWIGRARRLQNEMIATWARQFG